MKILFNKSENGQEEIKRLLGFLDADLTYENLETDIILNTPHLVEFIGQEMYDKIQAFYVTDQTGEGKEKLLPILNNAQLYILLNAYLDYASNGDILHGNAGRKIHFAENQKTPWDWQIKQDNFALKKRSYKALDLLIDQLDKSDFNEWLASDQYKTAVSLFLHSTKKLQKRYPVNNSGQLYYRMVPFMADIETETLKPILGATKYAELKLLIKKEAEQLEPQKELIVCCEKIMAFRSLQRATIMLPEEMLQTEINFKMSEQDIENIKENRSLRFGRMADEYEVELQRILARQAAVPYELNLTHGIVPGKKHVNL